MASINSELAIAKRFHMLCKTYDNRPVIARRNTLPSLTRFLGNQDREIRRYALEALHMLSQHPENVELLSDDRALVSAVFRLYSDTACDDPALHEVSGRVLDALEPLLQGRDPRRAGPSSGGRSTPNEADTFSATRRATTARVLRGVGTDAVRTVVLDLPALDAARAADLETIEDIFQTTRGVLSYSVFLESRQARLFLHGAVGALQAVLADAGFASLVVRDDVVGQDLFDGGGGRSYFDAGGGAARPSYVRSLASSVYQTALVLSGAGGGDGDSLAARVQQQRRREGEQQGNSTFTRITKSLAKWW